MYPHILNENLDTCSLLMAIKLGFGTFGPILWK